MAAPSLRRRATDIVPDRAVRPPAESLRTVSQPAGEIPAALANLRAGSHVVRIDAKQTFLAVIHEVRARLGLTVEVMAINAECPLSSMSDALAGKDGRNFAAHWLLAQGDEFLALFLRLVDERRGLTPESKRVNAARRISEIVRVALEELA
jgi:hypothetical protein